MAKGLAMQACSFIHLFDAQDTIILGRIIPAEEPRA